MGAIEVAVLQVSTEVFGWAYGITLVGYFVGLCVSMWRLRHVMGQWTSLEGAALAALAVGWPTGLRAQAQLRAGIRDTRSLVNPRTRPTLVVFAATFAPLLLLLWGLTGVFADWALWVELPLGLVALVTACATWLLDGST